MTRRKVSMIVFAVALLAILIVAPDIPLMVFAAILLAVFLRGGGDFIAARLGIGQMLGLAAFAVLLVVVAVAVGMLAAPLIAGQAQELAERIPQAGQALADHIRSYSWGPDLLDQIRPEGLLRSGGSGVASAVAGTFGAFGNLVILLIVGIYFAIDPKPYHRGLTLLFAPSLRPRVQVVLLATVRTLKRWLAAQLLAMATVGVLTGIGLWIVGIPLAPMLGLIAGLLAFIPTIGPILSMIPGLLLAFAIGPDAVLWALAVYLAVQALESYLITPIVQREMVSLPPALTITVQLLLGVLFGLIGLALATPMAAAGLTLVSMLYVDYLNREQAPLPAQPEPPTPAVLPLNTAI